MDAASSTLASNARAKTITAVGTPKVALLLALAAPLVFGLALGGLSFFQIFLPHVVLAVLSALAVALVLFVRRPWALIVAVIPVTLSGLLVLVDPIRGAFLRPSLGGRMSWGDTVVLAAIVALMVVAPAVRFTKGRAPSARSTAVMGAVAFVALGLALGIQLTTAASLADPGFQAGGAVVALQPDATLHIVASTDSFHVPTSVVKAGSIVKLTIDNQDSQLHSFTTTSGPTVDADAPASKTTDIYAKAPAQAGAWTFKCKYHPGMTGTITVT